MSFCKNCGVQMTDNSKFCAACGTSVETVQTEQTTQANGGAQTTQGQVNQNQTNQGYTYSNNQNNQANQGYANGQANQNASNFVNNFTNTADHTNEFEAQDAQENSVMALLSYIGILFLIPIFAAPNSKFARFHANQGLVLCLFELAGGIVVGILTAILMWIPILGWLLTALIGFAFGASVIVLAVLGIVNAVNKKAKELPIIGKISILK